METWGILRLHDHQGKVQAVQPYFGGPLTFRGMPAFLMARATITRSDGVERTIEWEQLIADRVVLGDMLAYDVRDTLHMSSLR